jgi:hypothetical protein
VLGEHLPALAIRYDTEVVTGVAEAGEVLGAVRGNAAIGIHEDGWTPDEATAYLARWGLTSERRAAKAVEFLLDPTWRAYIFCYIDGLRVCRDFVAGDPARFVAAADRS